MKPSIKVITIRKTLWLGFAFLVGVLLIIGFNFYSLINETMHDKGVSLAKSIETTLTSHMLTANFEEKEALVALAARLPGMVELKVVRSAGLNAQFGLPEQPIETDNALVRQVFDSAVEQVTLPSPFDAKGLIHIVYPYKAHETGPIKCLSCHEASPDEVLAVLDFKVDTSDYQGMMRLYLLILLVLFILALIMVGRVLIWVLDRNVRDPLQWLVQRTHESFTAHQDIDTSDIESMELDQFALKVNAFNQLVLKRNAELEAANEEIRSTQREIILIMGEIGETRSRETANHVRRVAELSLMLAKKSGLAEWQCQELHDASPMHDIGKVGIPDRILQKPGKLTDEEYAHMQQHSAMGYEVFRRSERPLLLAAGVIAYQHHERWDGQGYPQGLSGENIHIYGRIVAVADVFDALISRRCYKAPWPVERVYEYFEQSSGSQFDPALVRIVLEHFEEMRSIIEMHGD